MTPAKRAATKPPDDLPAEILEPGPPSYTAPEQVTVYEALRRVMLDVGAVGKDHEMTEGPRYSYRSIDDILARAQPSMIRHGVLIAPTQPVTSYEMRSTRGGGALQWVNLKVDWLVTGPMGDVYRDADGRIPGTAAEANDTSDKATNKAHTAAYKMLLCELLSIPFGTEDQDATRNELGTGTSGKTMTVVELWAEATFDQTDAADKLDERLNALDGELRERVISRTMAKNAELGNQPVTVEHVRDLDPGWLPWWEGIITSHEGIAADRSAAQS